jgi:membrane associated rhomboid family serine protease
MSEYSQYEFRFGGEREGITFVVHSLILVNVCIFALQLLLDIPFGDWREADHLGGSFLTDWVVFNPEFFLGGRVWTPITYMFLHGGLMHVFGNMLMLYFFGPEIERVLGSRQFLRFFLLCGAVGVLVNLIPHALNGGASNPFVAGASGATLGVLVAFAMVEPDRRVFIFPIPIPVTSRMLVMFIIFLNLMSAVLGGSVMSVATHFGGMAVAYLYMKWRPVYLRAQWKKRGKQSERPAESDEDEMAKAIDNIFDFKNRNR